MLDFDHGFGKLSLSPKRWVTEEKQNKTTDWEKIFANDLANKVSKIYK